jgi:uncharacterized protein (TIGR02246 family)
MKVKLARLLLVAAFSSAAAVAVPMPTLDCPIMLTAVSAELAATRSAVQEIFATYAKAANSLDVDSWLGLWDEEGVKFVAGVPAIVGKAAIGDFARPRWKKVASRTMSIKVEAVDRIGDYALARGTYLSDDTPVGASAAVTTDGWFMTTLKRQADGGWKIYRDCVAPEAVPK